MITPKEFKKTALERERKRKKPLTMRFPFPSLCALAFFLPTVVSVAVRNPNKVIGNTNGNAINAALLPSAHLSFPSAPMRKKIDEYFQEVAYVCDATGDASTVVLEAPVQELSKVKLYIAIDGDSFCAETRPGNGGLRLLAYPDDQTAIDDGVRLARGMSRKHDAYRTGTQTSLPLRYSPCCGSDPLNI